MAGWGQVFGKIADYIQGRDERRRNELEKLERERDEILKKPQSDRDTLRLTALIARIRVLEAQSKNT